MKGARRGGGCYLEVSGEAAKSMDIGEQKRVIIVEPEPVQVPVEEPIAPETAPPAAPSREPEPAPARR